MAASALFRRHERRRPLAPLRLGLVVFVGKGLQPARTLGGQRQVVDTLLRVEQAAASWYDTVTSSGQARDGSSSSMRHITNHTGAPEVRFRW